VNRQATLLECLRLSSYTLFYLLTVQLLSHGRQLATTVNALTGLVLLIVFSSILQRITAPDTLFWFRSLSDGKTAFGPWVYKNQYAGFMVMTCPLVLAQFLLYRPPVNRKESIREKFIALFSMDGANLHLLLGFGTIIVLASVFLTQSRGGILSISFTLLLYFLLLARKQERIQKLTPLILLTCLILIVSWFSWDPIIERFNSIFDIEKGRINDGRLPVWLDTFRIIADFPVTGAGFGTFANIFPSYKTFADNSLYNHAHNDFLELLTDGGLIGFILASWFIGTILRTGYQQIFSRQDSLSVFFSIGAFSGISGLLVYSLTDFNLHNGANGLYFASLCGLLVSAGHTRRYYRNRPSLLAPIRLSTGGKVFVWFVISFFLCAVLVIHGRAIIAERYFRLAKIVSASKQPHEKKLKKMAALLEQARKSDPVAGMYPYALANISKYRQQNKQALRLYAKAAMKQPMETAFLQNSGLLSAISDPSKGRALLESGYRRANLKAPPLQVWAEFELSHDNRAEAIRLLRNALHYDPELLKSVYPLLNKYSFEQEEIVAVLPEQTSVWINYWNHAKADGDSEEHDYFLEHSLDFIDRESQINPHYFMQVFHHYRKKENTDKAVEILQSGIQRLPDYAPFHIHLGDLYMKQGIAYRAGKEYEQALRLDPENTGIQNKIKKLKEKK
jgi:O-antigen ligase/tetratricopeptide (TPR) repeat protein